MSEEKFYQSAFGDKPLSWQTLWVSTENRQVIASILNHRFTTLRIRYQGSEQKTAWVFEEIGKEMPITIGVIINQGKVEKTLVLEYRETRGGEIRHPFFLNQFEGASLLTSDEDKNLDKTIDGITGATLSVRAMKRVVRVALYCHQLTPFHQQPANAGTE